MNTYCVPGFMLGNGNIEMNKTHVLSLRLVIEADIKEIHEYIITNYD